MKEPPVQVKIKPSEILPDRNKIHLKIKGVVFMTAEIVKKRYLFATFYINNICPDHTICISFRKMSSHINSDNQRYPYQAVNVNIFPYLPNQNPNINFKPDVDLYNILTPFFYSFYTQCYCDNITTDITII